tara:strand:- start:28 stop:441 length:414 start_codon:yes stop_codon:yes gene_type:complete
MLLRIHRIGVAVRNLDEATKNYVKIFDIKAGDVHYVPEKELRAILLDVGNAKLELIEPMGTEGVIAKFIESHGEGVHHICFEVDDINKALESLSAKGIPLRDKVPRQGITGKIAFLQEAINGMTIELVEKHGGSGGI